MRGLFLKRRGVGVVTDKLAGVENWLLSRAGADVPGRGWVVQVLAICSVSAMYGASPAFMARWVPWACAVAAGLEACYLGRLSLYIVRILRRLQPDEVGGLRYALLQLCNLLIGTLAFAMLLPFVARQALEGASSPMVARLLWLMGVGGLMVSIAIGELMRILLRVVEARLARRG